MCWWMLFHLSVLSYGVFQEILLYFLMSTHLIIEFKFLEWVFWEIVDAATRSFRRDCLKFWFPLNFLQVWTIEQIICENFYIVNYVKTQNS